MLLFDENLSPKLPAALADLYPGSVHAVDVGLHGEPDPVVRQYAAANGLAVVSRDRDMRRLSIYHGHPPKTIWLVVGNATTARMEAVLRANHANVLAFLADPAPTAALLVLS